MEVGAVKQAFNNEVILLKNNLKQAQIQVIHKLTRKAKTLAEKKAPGALKDKLKRKAESAVKEVLIIKKIKPRDIARFIVTHEGQLNGYLNKPNVDENKACARLLLHKSMTNKYKLIRSRFSNISIHDLLMSRQERRKLKKEAREKQKNKKKKQNGAKTDNVGGVWDVEINDSSKESKSNGNNDDKESLHDDNVSDTESENEHNDNLDDDNDAGCSDTDKEQYNVSEDKVMLDDYDLQLHKSVLLNENKSIENTFDVKPTKDHISNKKRRKLNDNTPMKIKPQKENINRKFNDIGRMKFESDINQKENKISNDGDLSNDDNEDNSDDLEANQTDVFDKSSKNKTDPIKILNTSKGKKNDKKVKDSNKNKNLNEKLEKRNFKKKPNDEFMGQMIKIADPFFVTSSGENYMSLVEPRLPDEIKDVHKEGNRQYRRAVMFGHVPRSKPRSTSYKNNTNFSQTNSYNNNKPLNKTNTKPEFVKKFKDKDTEIKNSKDDTVPEKLHPSWEAKKRQSTVVQFKGKKIMFDDS